MKVFMKEFSDRKRSEVAMAALELAVASRENYANDSIVARAKEFYDFLMCPCQREKEDINEKQQS